MRDGRDGKMPPGTCESHGPGEGVTARVHRIAQSGYRSRGHIRCHKSKARSMENFLYGHAHVPGKAPLIAKTTTTIVIRALSAMGSTMVPTTVCMFHRRAIHPSARSVMPAYKKSANAVGYASYASRYPTTGAATRRVSVRKLGRV